VKVELLHTNGLEFSDSAIGLCYDKGCHVDPIARDRRITKVALKHKHSSTIEFTNFIFSIEASTKVLLEMENQFSTYKYVNITKVNETKILLRLNGRTVAEKPLPYWVYEQIPESMRYLSRYVPISNARMYVVDIEGNVFKTSKDKIHDTTSLPKRISPFIDKYGYVEFTYTDNDGIRRHKSQHRLIMETFTSERDEHINHIDGDKQNNRKDNLEWCTASHNEKHSYSILGKQVHNKGIVGSDSHVAKRIIQMDLDGRVLREFGSSIEARDWLHDTLSLSSSSGGLSSALNRENNKYKGFLWKFA
jgi:hypothetical protein